MTMTNELQAQLLQSDIYTVTASCQDRRYGLHCPDVQSQERHPI